jgi:hypothetical protein
MYNGHNYECPEWISQNKKILSLDSIMVDRCVLLFALSKTMYYIKTS